LEIEIWLTAEADEMWSWVGNKKNQRWLWWVIDKKTGNVLGFAFGPRTNAVWKQLIADLKVVLDKYQVEYDILYTDGH
jgi:insertion element IS1 protein InsB